MGGVDELIRNPPQVPQIPENLPPLSTEPVADFEKAVAKVLAVEGGFVDHPADRGGATNHGITIGTLRDWRRRPVTTDDVRNLTVQEAKAIYKARYWDPMNLEGLHQAIAEVLFDQAVNFGPAVAARRAQMVLGRILDSSIKPDGVIGPKTKAALQAVAWRKFIKEYVCETQDAYVRIVRSNQSQLVFLAGWINRSQKLLDYLV